MARPTLAEAQRALNDLFAALTFGNTPWRIQRSGAAVDALGSVASAVKASLLGTAVTVTDSTDADLQALFAYPHVDFVVTDTADADLEAFAAAGGELYAALGRAPVVGDMFEVGGAGDTTANELATAKGGAVADGDIFIVSNATVSTIAVVYAGNLGRFGITLGRPVEVGDVFTVAGTGDTTDNALAAAKLAGLNIGANITVTDITDATVVAFLATTGELGVQLGSLAVPPRFRFKVGGTGDTTDNGLQTAKGSAPAAGDVFEVNAAGSGVTYVGNVAVAASDVFEVKSTTIGSEAVGYIGGAALDISSIKLGRGA